MWVVREYGLKLPAYAALNLGSALRELVRVLLYEKNKIAKLRAILKGMRDGYTISQSTAAKWLGATAPHA
jgi:hypothetical protein